MSTSLKSRIATAAQLLLGLGILAYIFIRLERAGNLGTLRDTVLASAAHWPLLIAGGVCFPICLFVCSIRWWILLREQGFNVSFRRVHELYYVGHFFNAFLLGATGGDVAKAYYVTHATTDRKTEAVATVIIDRLVGLLVLIGLCAAVCLLQWRFFMSTEITRIALTATLFATLGAIALILGIAAKPWLDRWSLFQKLTAIPFIGDTLNRMVDACHGCLKRPAVVVQTAVLSLVNHLAFVLCSYFLALAIGLKLTLVDQTTIFPLINMVAGLPITPSGIGTRDAAAIGLLAPFGVDEPSAVTLSLMVYGSLMLWSLVGGLIYMSISHRLGKPGAAAPRP